MNSTLYYIYDPMCPWCYAFKPSFDALKQQLPANVELRYVLGGLAAHTTQPMSKIQQDKIKSLWQQIQKEYHTDFNYDFWTKCTPYKATYLACQALILARQANKEELMLEAIQKAYYLKAQNPSLEEVLIKLACEIGLDKNSFEKALNNSDTQALLQEDLNLRNQLQVRVFPTLLLQYKKERYPISIDYANREKMLSQIKDLSSQTYF